MPSPTSTILVPAILAIAALALWAPAAAAAELVAHPQPIDDLKAVFGTVESLHQTSARARIGGTVGGLAVTEGQRVAAGERLAVVTDTKIALETTGVEARIQSAEAQLQLAQTEFDRANELFTKGVGTKSRVDTARTQLAVASRAVASLKAERNVLTEHGGEGAVLAPTNGRVLKVLVTDGSVVMPGEPLATIAVETYVLRVLLPERHARSIKVGDTVWVGARALERDDIRSAQPCAGLMSESPSKLLNRDGFSSQVGSSRDSTCEHPALAVGATPPRPGTVTKVYPLVENGRVTADVSVDGLGDYFVGERIPVHVATGQRQAFVVPRAAVRRRFGLDTVTLKGGTEVVVQLGQIAEAGVEVLAGLKDGDTVVWDQQP